MIVTQLKEKIKELEEKISSLELDRNSSKAILKSMVDGVVTVDLEKNILITNPAFREAFALFESKIIGKKIDQVFDNEVFLESLEELLDSSKSICREITFNQFNSKIFRCCFTPIMTEKRETIAKVIVFTDITELRRLEKIRKDFVANVSHELKTPLTSIIGYSDTLLENRIDDIQLSNHFLGIIKKEAERMNSLVRDLLNLSTIEGKTKIDLIPANLEQIIYKILKVIQKKANNKGIKLKLKIADNLPLVLMEPGQIKQVLFNLVDNAIKYTSSGGMVTISAQQREERIVVEVEDTGIGISKEEQQRIFERFYRSEKVRSSNMDGTGIGLAIVKHIINSHGSIIEVESQEGEGSLFRFFLNTVKNNEG